MRTEQGGEHKVHSTAPGLQRGLSSDRGHCKPPSNDCAGASRLLPHFRIYPVGPKSPDPRHLFIVPALHPFLS